MICQYKQKDSGAPGAGIIVLAIVLRIVFFLPFMIAAGYLVHVGTVGSAALAGVTLAMGSYALKILGD